jgi:hypothetical protein
VTHLPDLIVVVGAALLGYGVYLVAGRGVAFVVGGVMAIVLGLALDGAFDRRPATPEASP